MQPKQRLNILFLSGWYPSRVHSTLGNFVQRHAEAVATEHHVHVLYLTADHNLKTGFEIEQFSVSGVNHTIVYYRKSMFPLFAQWRMLRKGIKILKNQGRFNFDLLHLNVIWPAGWQALYLKRKFKIPFVVTEHWTGYDLTERPHPGKKTELLAKQVGKNADMICPVSENLAGVMRKFGIDGKYKVVPNVVDTKLFLATSKPTGICKFLHVSSLNESQKNIKGLLRAWKKAIDQHPQMHLHIGGDGPWQDARAYSREIDIPPASVSFFGEMAWNGIAELMKDAHAFVLFSNYENLPCVIVEAMASGMAVISTRVGGISEHINSGNGYLIPPRDEQALAQAFVSCAAEHSKFDPQLLRSYAEKHFSIPSVAKQFTEIYNEVLSNAKNLCD